MQPYLASGSKAFAAALAICLVVTTLGFLSRERLVPFEVIGLIALVAAVLSVIYSFGQFVFTHPAAPQRPSMAGPMVFAVVGVLVLLIFMFMVIGNGMGPGM